MMYSNKAVIAIKVGGKILRETGDVVHLPFGAEYSILLKNLNSARVKVKVRVDGVDATDGTALVLNGGQSLDLERYISNGNLSSGNRFKFIERTGDIEKHRGIGAEDGLVHVEFKTEKPYHSPFAPVWPFYERRNNFNLGAMTLGRRSTDQQHQFLRSAPNTLQPKALFLGNISKSEVSFASMGEAAPTATVETTTTSDIGITVPGSESGQQFYTVSDFAVEDKAEVLVLHLRGALGEKAVQAPVTVERKLTCASCGLLGSSHHKFCFRCGTALHLI